MATKIHFRVNKQKIYNAILYIMWHGETRPYNIMKILAVADKIMLNDSGRPVAGDVILSETHGMTPKYAKEIVVATWNCNPDFYHNNETLTIKAKPDMGFLAGADIAAIEQALQIYSGKDTTEVERINHEETAWLVSQADGLTEIPTEMLLEGGIDNKFYEELVDFGPAIVF